jgi:ABC-type antimicrobial peptide transport system permease subunit
MEEIEGRFKQEKLFAQACGLFGIVALILASVGLFGLMSYNVARRTPEMGIRMALGAQRVDVLQMVMRESLLLVAVGLVAGLALAAGSGPLITKMLFGLAPRDATTIGVSIAMLLAVSALAAYLPARRASRIDPMVALRYE